MNEDPPTRGPEPGGSTDAQAGARILLVEDFDPLRRLMIRVLTLEGHEVEAVGTASRALALGTSEHFDLLITDHDVPGGKGTEIARRSVAYNPGLKVLFISGSAEASLDLEVPGVAAGFLQKPFGVDNFELHVRQILTPPA